MSASFKIAAIASASIALALTAGAASATEINAFQSNGRTAEVYHGDLDLTKADQRQHLQARISRAAGRVCSNGTLAEQQACRKLAVAQVQSRVSAAIARAETKERYADATPATREARPVVGN
ncbi:UrcA family protein [Sphingobium sp. CCH11-B1]|jgi:UrcA family protein|uniref:UrcA family protein n=1 Tax=Sphingobium sp. CCH11-B1 TaxID=1768781 RepID=UPI00082BF408|nr:UrcA family protein [Sphingobium sp. CCH11-B1]MEA3391240.1 UrcA family protein [Pseudomonadota bacterium]